jgi:hypothetical protein
LNFSNIGSLIGNYQGVRNAVADGLSQMVTSGMSAQAAAAFAQNEANTAIQNYNSRIGAD